MFYLKSRISSWYFQRNRLYSGILIKLATINIDSAKRAFTSRYSNIFQVCTGNCSPYQITQNACALVLLMSLCYLSSTFRSFNSSGEFQRCSISNDSFAALQTCFYTFFSYFCWITMEWFQNFLHFIQIFNQRSSQLNDLSTRYTCTEVFWTKWKKWKIGRDLLNFEFYSQAI